MRLEIRILRRKITERFLFWIVWHLPKIIIYFAGIRLWAYASMGKYSNDECPSMLMSDVMERWNN